MPSFATGRFLSIEFSVFRRCGLKWVMNLIGMLRLRNLVRISTFCRRLFRVHWKARLDVRYLVLHVLVVARLDSGGRLHGILIWVFIVNCRLFLNLMVLEYFARIPYKKCAVVAMLPELGRSTSQHEWLSDGERLMRILSNQVLFLLRGLIWLNHIHVLDYLGSSTINVVLSLVKDSLFLLEISGAATLWVCISAGGVVQVNHFCRIWRYHLVGCVIPG